MATGFYDEYEEYDEYEDDIATGDRAEISKYLKYLEINIYSAESLSK